MKETETDSRSRSKTKSRDHFLYLSSSETILQVRPKVCNKLPKNERAKTFKLFSVGEKKGIEF
jgi:hypothetical protein